MCVAVEEQWRQHQTEPQRVGVARGECKCREHPTATPPFQKNSIGNQHERAEDRDGGE